MKTRVSRARPEGKQIGKGPKDPRDLVFKRLSLKGRRPKDIHDLLNLFILFSHRHHHHHHHHLPAIPPHCSYFSLSG